MLLRRAKQEDLSRILIVFEQAIRQTCKANYTTVQIEVWTMATEKIAKWQSRIEEQYFLVAEMDNVIVGFGSLEGKNYLDLMYVHPKYGRKGVAKHLYLALEKESKARGSSFWLSDVSITARPFLECQGFRVLHPNQNLIGGVELVNFRMRKDF